MDARLGSALCFHDKDRSSSCLKIYFESQVLLHARVPTRDSPPHPGREPADHLSEEGVRIFLPTTLE